MLNSALRHEDVWVGEVWLHTFLTSTLAGGEGPASRPDRFTSIQQEARWAPDGKNLLLLVCIEPIFPPHPACGPVTIFTELPHLQNINV